MPTESPIEQRRLQSGVILRAAGEQVERLRWVPTDRDVVAVQDEAVIPNDDPSEPCLEPETVPLLRDVEAHARAGDVEWLRRHGKVHEAVDVA